MYSTSLPFGSKEGKGISYADTVQHGALQTAAFGFVSGLAPKPSRVQVYSIPNYATASVSELPGDGGLLVDATFSHSSGEGCATRESRTTRTRDSFVEHNVIAR